MCTSIREGIKWKKSVPYTRLISEILYQGRLLQKVQDLGVSSDEELGTKTGKVVNGTMLGFMKIIWKMDVIISKNDLKLSARTTDLLDDFPPISLEDPLVVIAEYIAAYYKETGVPIKRDQIPDKIGEPL
ncbi:hypothetical protein MtrunA17_Chr8g0365081 [Medicago truncatula]|uniref:Uncharacterized protein n=1 Tax=Medicago truncatula TaxID=3880 RepID=A0A396GP49_MEDTR|nr:hypothetical protein MtrunA17_Chr8g0365081 [Medicago truncatula]